MTVAKALPADRDRQTRPAQVDHQGRRGTRPASGHLGHANEAVSNPAGNARNGKSRKMLKGEFGELPIDIPRDRHGSFEPQLIPKRKRVYV